jgi:hypothetical protein
MTDNDIYGTAILTVWAAIFGGIAIYASASESEERRLARLRLRNERAAKKAAAQKARAMAENAVAEAELAEAKDRVSVLGASETALKELLGMEFESRRFSMYEAMKEDGVEFSNVQKQKLRNSFPSFYRNLV